jgi:predicted dithiol-disulfide oxidoreductase (DUF899 family)
MTQRTVSREAWLEERRQLLEEEKALTRARETLAAKRRELPRVLVEEDYEFDTERGRERLVDLFGEKSQLVVQHFMFGPDWEEGCKSCSFWSDNMQGALPHLSARDVSYVAVSQAPLDVLLSFRERMGWRHDWVSSAPCNFSNDYHVWYTPEQIAAGETAYNFQPGLHYGEHAPGFSVFLREGDRVFHTYSCYARGLDMLNGAYQVLDLVPKGRDEADLPMPMAWVRLHDRY